MFMCEDLLVSSFNFGNDAEQETSKAILLQVLPIFVFFFSKIVEFHLIDNIIDNITYKSKG